VLREARGGGGVGLSCGAPVLRYNRAAGWEQVITVVLAVLVAVLYNNRRFDDVNGRIDDVHRRIDDLRSDMNARFAQVDARFGEVHARLSELREDLREIRGMLQEALRGRAPCEEGGLLGACAAAPASVAGSFAGTTANQSWRGPGLCV
jgi:hypothetical protein